MIDALRLLRIPKRELKDALLFSLNTLFSLNPEKGVERNVLLVVDKVGGGYESRKGS